MNPLTLVKRIQNINSKEAALGISENASWHSKYKDSAYVFVGGIPFDLTEGDLLAVFAQYGEIVDVNLVRDKGTGKSKGFAFVAYEDQRSTNLAVDNLNGAQVLGRVIRVDHVSNYKKKQEEEEEEQQRKREERGVCHAFQRGECNRGAGCKFSHNENRAANTGWGPDQFDRSTLYKMRSKRENSVSDLKGDKKGRSSDEDGRNFRSKIPFIEKTVDGEPNPRTGHGWKHRGEEEEDRRGRSSRDEYDRREEKRGRRYEAESSSREDRDSRVRRDRRPACDRDSHRH